MYLSIYLQIIVESVFIRLSSNFIMYKSLFYQNSNELEYNHKNFTLKKVFLQFCI